VEPTTPEPAEKRVNDRDDVEEAVLQAPTSASKRPGRRRLLRFLTIERR
jgi:hypothetical protein